MTYDINNSEPKKLYLNLLISLDFQVSYSLFRAKNYSDAINGMAQILGLIVSNKKPELKAIHDKIAMYQKQSSAPTDELVPIFNELQEYLSEKWFSELHLGVVPTSTLASDAKIPDSRPLSPTQTNKI